MSGEKIRNKSKKWVLWILASSLFFPIDILRHLLRHLLANLIFSIKMFMIMEPIQAIIQWTNVDHGKFAQNCHFILLYNFFDFYWKYFLPSIISNWSKIHFKYFLLALISMLSQLYWLLIDRQHFIRNFSGAHSVLNAWCLCVCVCVY